MRHVLLGLAVLLSSVGCGAAHRLPASIPPRAVLSDMEEHMYHIGPEDVLTVTVDGVPTDVTVRSDGYISMPAIRELHVGGMMPGEAQIALDKAAPTLGATIDVKQINSRKVWIVGQVMKPGVYPMPGKMTILQALALSGTFAEWAKTKRIVIVRDTGAEYPTYYRFSYRDIEKRKRVQIMQLRPDDVIVIP
jgi:polysaccharide export outer membrane protein